MFSARSVEGQAFSSFSLVTLLRQEVTIVEGEALSQELYTLCNPLYFLQHV